MRSMMPYLPAQEAVIKTPGSTLLVVRRPPAGHKAGSAHDMGREVRFLKALAPVYAGLPRVHAHCTDPSVADGAFYAMERLRGIILRQDLPDELQLSLEQTRSLCTNTLDKLIALHQIDIQQNQLSHLGKGSGYVARQIAGWSRRYAAAPASNAFDGKGHSCTARTA